jgi:transposase
MAARHRVVKQLLRHGHIYREGKKAWTLQHRAWVHRQRLDDALAQLALEQMLIHLDSIERQLAALDARIEQIARSDRWHDQVSTLTAFRGISTCTALGLIAEIGDFRRFSHPRELLRKTANRAKAGPGAPWPPMSAPRALFRGVLRLSEALRAGGQGDRSPKLWPS